MFRDSEPLSYLLLAIIYVVPPLMVVIGVMSGLAAVQYALDPDKSGTAVLASLAMVAYVPAAPLFFKLMKYTFDEQLPQPN